MEQESKILTHEEMLELAYEREQANEQLEEQKKEENCNDGNYFDFWSYLWNCNFLWIG